MEFLTLINKLEPYMERVTRHYKQRNVDALIYENTNNKSITINSEDTYTPRAILIYNTPDHIALTVQVYNTVHDFNTSDITNLVITWQKKKKHHVMVVAIVNGTMETNPNATTWAIIVA